MNWRLFISITLSASDRNEFEMFNPIALAVRRLITSSNLLCCWTGRSPGFSPRRMRHGLAARRYKSTSSGPRPRAGDRLKRVIPTKLAQFFHF